MNNLLKLTVFLFLMSKWALSQSPLLVKNIHPSFATSSYPQNLVSLNGTLYFSADDGNHGFELWKTDGTTSGTVQVKDLTPGVLGTDNLRDFTTTNSQLFFTCRTGTELWVSNGNASGTDTLITFPDIGTIQDNSLFPLDNSLLFVTQDFSSGNLSLWKSNGTVASTVKLKTFSSGGNSIHFSTFKYYNNEVYFVANDGVTGQEVWKTDGTATGTVILKDINSGMNDGTPWPDSPFFNLINGELFFVGNDGVSGNELWKTDGTSIGTTLIKDIKAGVGSSNISSPICVGKNLYFHVFINGKTALWKSDGTNTGTVKIIDLSRNDFMIALDSNTLIFNQDNTSPINYGRELWKTKGTPASTVLLKDINPGNAHGLPANHFKGLVIDSILYFNGQETTHGLELWRSDGTDTGTYLVKDLNPGTGDGFLNNSKFLFDGNGNLFFDAISRGGGSSTELWQSNGTDTGTIRLDVDTNGGGSIPLQLTLIDTTLFFTANDGFTGVELYSTIADSIKKKVIVAGPPSFISETNLSNSFDIYPNPTTGTFYLIKDNSLQLGAFNMKITSIEGKIMTKKSELNYSREFNISDYPKGIYLVIITDNKGGIFRKKLVKH